MQFPPGRCIIFAAMPDVLTCEDMRIIIGDFAETMNAHADQLGRLDLAIGDGDHGRNMALGFRKVRTELHISPPPTPGILLRSTGMILVTTIGGASGPLYGAAYIAAGIATRGQEALSLADLAHVAQSAAEALARRGRCHLGDKTILDALEPAAHALSDASHAGQSVLYGLQAAADAAHAGMKATIPLVARCGLAMQYGPASAGHQDPGATSCYLMFDSAVRTFRRLHPAAH